MKTIQWISLFSLILTGVTAQNKQEKTIEPFVGISASGAVNIKYRNSDTNKVVLFGETEDFNHVEFYVKENTLFIKSSGIIKNPLSVYISGNKLNQIFISGATSFKTYETIQVPDFNIFATGAGNVNMNLNTSVLKVSLTGASDVNLNGYAQKMSASINGAASLKAYNLSADTCLIDAGGVSNSKVYVSQKISINATGNSSVKFKGNPKEIGAEGGSSSRIMKIGSDEMSASVTPQDSGKNKTTFRIKNKQITVMNIHDRRKDSIGNRHRDFTRKHWQGLWIGFAGYTNPQHGFTMNKSTKYMELDYGKSFNFQWNIIQRNLNLYKKHIQLSTGIGFQFSNLSFENKTKLNADSSYTSGVIDSSGKYTYTKNRFKQAYVVVPLLLNFNTSNNLRHNVHFTCGVVGKYLLTSRTKQILSRNSYEYTVIRKDSYNLNPFQADAYASIGYRNITVFAQTGLTDMFLSGKGAQLYSFSAGIRLISFN